MAATKQAPGMSRLPAAASSPIHPQSQPQDHVRQLHTRLSTPELQPTMLSSRILARLAPLRSTPLSVQSRAFRSSARRLETAAQALPAKRPVGAFRGGLIGFLLGTSLGAYGSYYYLFEEYTRSNDLLTEDMYALQAAVTRLHKYVESLEEKLDNLGRRR